ncbi:MAG: hypothetical protein NZ703_10500, partial [Gemmataceae bacterium]|nr:hypothetical protein [Gemmataceae bacterium]
IYESARISSRLLLQDLGYNTAWLGEPGTADDFCEADSNQTATANLPACTHIASKSSYNAISNATVPLDNVNTLLPS